MELSLDREVTVDKDDLIRTLVRLGGFYHCPRQADGTRLGPLIGYVDCDEKGRQYVGDVFLDGTALAERPSYLLPFAEELQAQLIVQGFLQTNNTVYCATPEGGVVLATLLAMLSRRRLIYPEQKIIRLPLEPDHERSELIWNQHRPEVGERVIIVQDVCSKFSTIEETIRLTEQLGAVVIGIVCLVNCSASFPTYYLYGQTEKLPIVSVLSRPFSYYHQDEPTIAADLRRYGFIANPYQARDRLQEIMVRYPPIIG